MTNESRRDLGSTIKLAATLLALVVLVLFIALNFDEVQIDILVATQTMRLAFALIFAAALGFLVGYFAPRR